MKKIKLYLNILAIIANLSVNAVAQNTSDSYDQYRKQVLANYQGFRKSVLDNYVDYLNTIWKEYKAFKGIVRDINPKPITPPNTKNAPKQQPVNNKPIVEAPIEKEPTISPLSNVIMQPSSPTQFAPVTQELPFSFYGFTLNAPRLNVVRTNSINPKDVAKVWQTYEQHRMSDNAKRLLTKAKILGLNDWFTFDMVRQCVNSQCRAIAANDRILLQQFLLAHMGYDVRIARVDKQLILLVAFKNQVYARSYLTINDHNYYIFTDNDFTLQQNTTIYTCEFPTDTNCGQALDLHITQVMRLKSEKIHSCTLKWNNMIIQGEVDINVMEMLRHYPQMEIPAYAISIIAQNLRHSILEQLKPQITNLSTVEAAEKLLHFVQYAFSYDTDDKQHGYEKPYFLEENFYYPKNDCEDRSVLYAYLVRNLLDLDVHFIHYPGHECTAVCFGSDNVKGHGYLYKGKQYIICDPTYIGASLGQCMPDYLNENPQIEIW